MAVSLSLGAALSSSAASTPLPSGPCFRSSTASAAAFSTPKQPTTGYIPLPIRMTCCSDLPNLLRRPARLAAAGNLLPGPGAANIYNDFAFALPGGAKESYFELKSPLIAARLADLAPLWEHFPALPDAGARQRALLDYNGPASVRKRLPES